MERVAALLVLGAVLPAVAAGLDDLAFLEGHWRTEAFGGTVEEIWLPAHGDVMHGVFRAVSDGTMSFSEFLQITVEGEGLVLRFAHFRQDYSTWEGDGPVMELRVAESRDGYVRFEARNDASPPEITYTARGDDALDVTVSGIEQILRFRRVQ